MEDIDYYEQLMITFEGCSIKSEKSGASEEIELLNNSIKTEDLNGDEKEDLSFYYLENHDGISYEVINLVLVDCKRYIIENTLYREGIPFEDLDDISSVEDYKKSYISKVSSFGINEILKNKLINNWNNYIDEKFDE